ncbi:MAG: hypothetical protein ACPGDB_02250, partial [Fusobacterium sp.]
NGTHEVKYGLCHEHCTPEQHLDLHPHFHCSKCQQIICLEDTFIPKMELPDRFTAKEINMTISPLAKHYLKINNKKYMLSKLLDGKVRSINLKIKI